MKRTIKFRGKCLDDGSWVYGYFIKYLTGRCFIHEPVISSASENDVYEYEIDPETVGQFTGLHDKNGKEIYEGDIILLSRQSTCIVLWNEEHSAFCIKFTDSEKVGTRPLGNWINYLGRKIEVIGNIHDNPELLKGGQNEND